MFLLERFHLYFIKKPFSYHPFNLLNFTDETLPITMQFKFPDPMIITVGEPFHLLGGSVVREPFPTRFKIKHKMERKFLGRWWTIPCVGEHHKEIKPFYEYEDLNDKPW